MHVRSAVLPLACGASAALALASCFLGGASPNADGKDAGPQAACVKPTPVARQLRLLSTREYQATLADLTGVAIGSAQTPSCAPTKFSYVASGAQPTKVHVAGSFNGWPATIAAGGLAMTLANGAWSAQTALATGEYQYKFVLDESQWIADPSNPKTVPDGFGGVNSVVDVACPTAPPSVDAGKNLPPDTRPDGFFFDDDGPGRVVTSVHTDEYLRSALAVSVAIDTTKIVTCDGKSDPAGCAHTFVSAFGQKVFRRPLTANESARLEKLVTGATDFGKGVRASIAAMLVSPSFLYRTELGTSQVDGTFRLTSWEVASVLSYGFWGTMPDDELFAAAQSGEIATPAGLEKQARRLLASPRARPQIGFFAEQWLGAENVSTVDKNATLYPDFDQSMRASMREETREVVERIFFDTRKMSDVYAANWTIANEALAKQYGIAGVSGPDMRVVSYPDGTRAGVLGHGSILVATGLSDETSPIRRGLFVRRRLLCQDFPPPPPSGGALPPVDPNATTRERFAQHTADPFCQSCHQYIDGVGFGFEELDTVGRYRTSEAGQPIDPTGDMNDVEGLGTATHAPFADLAELGQILAASHAATDCVAKQYWRFMRGVTESDACSYDGVKNALVASGGDPIEMMVAVVLSPDFLVRK